MPETNVFEVEMLLRRLKRYKSSGIDNVPVNGFNLEVGQCVLTFINFLNRFGIRKNCLNSGRSESCTYL
jgi:hypothetical protein